MNIPQEHTQRVKSAWMLSSLVFLLSCSAPVATLSPASRHQPALLTTQSTESCSEPGSKIPQVYKAPGHKPGSKEPWVFFLGNAAHEAITYVYGVYHPANTVYYNSVGIRDIVRRERIGDDSRLLENERKLRPDITDVTDRVLFELKPDNTEGLQEGRVQAKQYLAALNRTIVSGDGFMGGTDFQGAILLQFQRGLRVWRLEWHTPEPGVTLYRWKRSPSRHDTPKEALPGKAMGGTAGGGTQTVYAHGRANNQDGGKRTGVAQGQPREILPGCAALSLSDATEPCPLRRNPAFC